MKNKILITGGAGFIGSNLTEYFLNKGYKIKVLDNLSTGFIHNIQPFFENESFTFIEGDIRDPDTCREAVKGVDYVLHEAALGSVPRSIKDPIATNETNVSGFLNMLIAARDEKVKRFVYAASSSTYGDSTSLPKVEEVIGKPLSAGAGVASGPRTGAGASPSITLSKVRRRLCCGSTSKNPRFSRVSVLSDGLWIKR